MNLHFPVLPPLSFLLAAILCYLFTPVVKNLAIRAGAVAIPRDRDVHKEPIPRWGGVAMYAAFMVTIALILVWVMVRTHLNAISHDVLSSHARSELPWSSHLPFPWSPHQMMQFGGILLGATLVAIVGALDDKFELSALWQSAALIGAGVILCACNVRIEGITNPFAAVSSVPHAHYDPRSWIEFSKPLSYFFTILWVFGVAKTVDFMDGLDGLAAGISAISGITLALMAAQAGQYEISILAAALVGVCVGFLRHNYNPATIIMGTIGAQFLGFLLAAIAVVGTFKIAATLSVILPIIVLGVPIFDGIRVVTTRMIKRVPAHHPDRTTHLHHILINKGLSIKQEVGVIYGIAAACCAFAWLIFHFKRW